MIGRLEQPEARANQRAGDDICRQHGRASRTRRRPDPWGPLIADADYAHPAERDAIAVVAGAVGLRFDGMWVEAPQAILERRLAARQADASDADADVLHRQLRTDAGRVDWRRLDGSADIECVSRDASAAVEIVPISAAR